MLCQPAACHSPLRTLHRSHGPLGRVQTPDQASSGPSAPGTPQFFGHSLSLPPQLHTCCLLPPGPLGICFYPGNSPPPAHPPSLRTATTTCRRMSREDTGVLSSLPAAGSPQALLPCAAPAQSWPGRPWRVPRRPPAHPPLGAPHPAALPLLPRGLLALGRPPGSGPWASSPTTCVRPPCWPRPPRAPAPPCPGLAHSWGSLPGVARSGGHRTGGTGPHPSLYLPSPSGPGGRRPQAS